MELLTWLWVWDIHFPELFLPMYFCIPKHTSNLVAKVWLLPVIFNLSFTLWSLFFLFRNK